MLGSQWRAAVAFTFVQEGAEVIIQKPPLGEGEIYGRGMTPSELGEIRYLLDFVQTPGPERFFVDGGTGQMFFDPVKADLQNCPRLENGRCYFTARLRAGASTDELTGTVEVATWNFTVAPKPTFAVSESWNPSVEMTDTIYRQ